MKRTLALSLLAALPLTLVHVPEAQACGGTFCDTGPQSMPVDQTGENILFILDGQSVEAHIQIQYDPEADADKFAWVIPVQVLPEFSVGSEALFQNMLTGTVPSYGYNTIQEPCGDPTDSGESGDPNGTGDGDGDWGGDGDGEPPDPMVVFNEIVGAYEIAVLQGGTIEGVMTWLADNDYQQDPNAEPILGDYLEQGYLFVALKLAMNTEVSEIHPIVLRYEGDEPCVPLKLTRIAAVDDMAVRVFMLGAERAVPTNYRHVLVNPLKIDWMSFGANYKEVVSLAVDAFGAEGNAFVTEYAGSSGAVSSAGLIEPGWDATPFAAMANNPEDAGAELEAQGLMQCSDLGGGVIECESHQLVEGLLAQYLPVPDGVDAGNFYSCMPCYAGLINDLAWDAAAFSAALDQRVVQPGMHASELLETHAYLTRMYTTISPNEMTVDPIFHTNPDLPDIPNTRQGTRTLLCEGGATFELPDGRTVYMPSPNVWPDVAPNEMPWEEDVELGVLNGPNQVISDQTPLINELLAAWNEQNGWPPDGGTGDGDGDSTDSGDGDGDDGQGSGSEGESGSGPNDGSGDAGIDGEQASCACSSEGGQTDLGGALGLFALLGLGWGLRRRED